FNSITDDSIKYLARLRMSLRFANFKLLSHPAAKESAFYWMTFFFCCYWNSLTHPTTCWSSFASSN
ncbi:unnamed protein product, partial [Allacma fusca]